MRLSLDIVRLLLSGLQNETFKQWLTVTDDRAPVKYQKWSLSCVVWYRQPGPVKQKAGTKLQPHRNIWIEQ